MFDIPDTEDHLLACLLLEDTGLGTLNKCRDAGLTEATFTVSRNADLFRLIAARIDAGSFGHIIVHEIESLEHRPKLLQLVLLEPTCALRDTYIKKLRDAEKLCRTKRDALRLFEEVNNPNADKIVLAGLARALMPQDYDYAEILAADEYFSDNDSSLRFAQEHVSVLRYCVGIGWLSWDKRRWSVEGDGCAIELSRQSARRWLHRWGRYNGDDRWKRIKAALAFESVGHIKATVELAKVDLRLVIPIERLDRDAWKLNVLNGTIDLRTGKLELHKRDDLLTKLAPVNYDRAARHPILDRYLNTIEKTTPGMGAFLARCFGAALTGDASAETMFLLQGDGGSGKTTLVEAVAAMMGDYAVKLQFQSFCLAKHGRGPGAASPDLIPLRGSRLAYASEGDQSAQLDAGMVKMLTGNEPITARGLYLAPIIFPQTWKLWLVSNFDPKADSEDTGIWRRMMKLHFAVIPEGQRDPLVKRTLTEDQEARSALLAWAVAGCIDWQARGGGRIGLAPPDVVTAATNAYRVKQDSLAEWWGDLLACDAELNGSEWETVGAMRGHYDDWCKENSAAPVYIKRFNAYLESKGLQQKRVSKERRWFGIKMAS